MGKAQNAYSERIANYVKKYDDIAVKEMKRSGVPASITLAQGILESDAGNSKLAREANNHFGIKCHSSWTGRKIYKDDDRKNECFRVYKDAEESFKDHSDFLKNGRRYAFLFEYKITDYKKWATGLKKAGYATNPKYPRLLIDLIELYDLDKYDKRSSFKHLTKDEPGKKKKEKIVLSDSDDFQISLSENHKIELNNRVKYIVVKKGDTYAKIAREFEMPIKRIFKYNDLPKSAGIVPGQKLYLQPKRNKAESKYKTHIVKQGETMYTISQKYGVKLSKLYRKNKMKPGSKLKSGTKIYLRQTKK